MRSIILRYIECQKRKNLPKIWLFYGFRNLSSDCLYLKELISYVNQCEGNLLITLCVSRPPNNQPTLYNFPHQIDVVYRSETCRGYVQDGLIKHGKELSSIIVEEEAYIYICGNSNQMPTEVKNVLQEIVGFKCNDSRLFMERLIKSRHLQEETWK